jgi:hypothetical protein
MTRKVVYIAGALKNPRIPVIAQKLEELTGYEVFADWFSPGPDADTCLREYIKTRNPNAGIKEALASYAAQHVFNFDREHIDRSDALVAVAPFGKSAALELGYVAGQGKPTFVLFEEEPERYDIMFLFATGIVTNVDELAGMLKEKLGGWTWSERLRDDEYDVVDFGVV